MTENPNATFATGQNARNIHGIESQLNELWAQMAHATGEDAIMRSTTLNLILFTAHPASVEPVLASVIRRHPCRAIVVVIDSRGDSHRLEAIPSVFCLPSLGSTPRAQVCCEQITLEIGIDAIPLLGGAVRPLLIGEEPTAIYWSESLPGNSDIIRWLGESLDAVIVDSAIYVNAQHGFEAQRALQAGRHFHAYLADLAWARTEPWRLAVARFFDDAHARGALETLESVVIAHRHNRAEALLMLGWLVGRLRWRITHWHDDAWTVLTPAGVTADISLHRLHTLGERSLIEISLTGEIDGADAIFKVRNEPDQQALICTAEPSGQQVTLGHIEPTVGDLLGQHLDRMQPDESYAETIQGVMLLLERMEPVIDLKSGDRGRVEVFHSAEALAHEAAQRLVFLAVRTVAEKRTFSMAISGGSTPKRLYEMLASAPFVHDFPWEETQVFWADERHVPHDSPDSNVYLFQPVLHAGVLPDENIFRWPTELTPEAAASTYAQTIHKAFHLSSGDLPRFDLVLLGMGEDGHTASLFPGTQALNAPAEAVAVHNFVPRLNTNRLTLTAGAINNASEIWFMTAGTGKAAIVKSALQGAVQPDVIPAQRIRPTSGKLVWMLDEPAAADLAR